jgi:hypothetical protein
MGSPFKAIHNPYQSKVTRTISVYENETPVTVLETGQPEHGLGVKMDKRAVRIVDRLLTWIYSREAGYLTA